MLGWKCFQLLELFEKAKIALASTLLKSVSFSIFFFLLLFCLTTVQNDRCVGGKRRELGKYDNSHNWFPRFISSWFYIWSNCVVCWYSVGSRHEPYVSFAFINISIAQQENSMEIELTDLCITSQSWHLSIPYSKVINLVSLGYL